MMVELPYVLVIVIGSAVCLYLLGVSLIDAYFRRKEGFVNKLYSNVKGSTHGTYP